MLKYWPGGIPEQIRWTENLVEDISEAVKCWQLFLEENCVPRDGSMQDPSYELHQRRSLLQKWASMTQEARDQYQRRAPVRENAWWCPATAGKVNPKVDSPPFAWCYCLASLENPRSQSRALWTKTRILLYHLDGNGIGPLMGDEDVAVAAPNPARQSPLTPETYLNWRFVEAADFSSISMSPQGTLTYVGWGSVFLADEEALETGLLLFCDFTHNGTIRLSKRMRPVVMNLEIIHWQQGRSIDTIIESCVSSFHQPVDMEQPVIDILHDIADVAFDFDGDYDTWKEDIEKLAPGYLELEEVGEGIVSDYDNKRSRTQQALNKIDFLGV